MFATGFSMGAIMTITIGCGEGDVFRAIAAMSGEISGSCSGSHPIAYWASHGMSDPTIAIANGQAARDKFVSIELRQHDAAADANGCVAYQGCTAGDPGGLVSVRRRARAAAVRRPRHLELPLAVLTGPAAPAASACRCSRAVVRSARIARC